MEYKRDAMGRLTERPADLPGRTRRKPLGPRRFKHYKIDALLTGEAREEYGRLLNDANVTLRQLGEWLAARGHRVSHNAISKHRLHHHNDFQGLREASQMASAFCDLSRKYGPGALAEATHARFEMMLMQNLFHMRGAPAMEPEQWQSMSKLVTAAVSNRRNVEEMREEYEARARAAAAAAEQAAGSGASTQDVVDRVKEILGV